MCIRDREEKEAVDDATNKATFKLIKSDFYEGKASMGAVSYTHLDVYKRQHYNPFNFVNYRLTVLSRTFGIYREQ